MRSLLSKLPWPFKRGAKANPQEAEDGSIYVTFFEDDGISFTEYALKNMIEYIDAVDEKYGLEVCEHILNNKKVSYGEVNILSMVTESDIEGGRGKSTITFTLGGTDGVDIGKAASFIDGFARSFTKSPHIPAGWEVESALTSMVTGEEALEQDKVFILLAKVTISLITKGGGF